jgi:hypothetical protein
MLIDFTAVGQQVSIGEFDKDGLGSVGGGMVSEVLIAETQTTGADTDSAVLKLDPTGIRGLVPAVGDVGYLNVKIICASLLTQSALNTWEADIAYKVGASVQAIYPTGGSLSAGFSEGDATQKAMPSTPTIAFAGNEIQFQVSHTSGGPDAHFRWVALVSGPHIHNAYGS